MEVRLKDEADCVYDAETYGEDEDDEDDEPGEDGEYSEDGSGRCGRGGMSGEDGNRGQSGLGGMSSTSGVAGELGTKQHWALRKNDMRRQHDEDEGPQMLGHGHHSDRSAAVAFGRGESYRSRAKARVKQGFEPPSSVRKIQCQYRGKRARNEVEKRKRAVLTVQSGVRGKLAKNEVNRRKQAIVTIQSRIRGRLARKKVQAMVEVKKELKHALRGPLQSTKRAKAKDIRCYWCQVHLDVRTADQPDSWMPRLASPLVVAPLAAKPPAPLEMPLFSSESIRDTIRKSGSQPMLLRPASAGLLRSVVYVPPPSPPSRPSSAASRVSKATRIPRVPSADVLRNKRGKWPLPRAASAAVWKKAGVGFCPEGQICPERLDGPDHYVWLRASGVRDSRRSGRPPNHVWEPIVGRLV